jgi:two-component system chemotaxis response regulator CheY
MEKALVIDDSRAVRAVLSKTMSQFGFEVVLAGNGKEAMEMLAANAPSIRLALVDWNMPVLSGIEFVRQVRACPEWNSIRLMMVTTETEMEQVISALEAGADEYIIKPFTTEAIEDKLRLLGVIH